MPDAGSWWMAATRNLEQMWWPTLANTAATRLQISYRWGGRKQQAPAVDLPEALGLQVPETGLEPALPVKGTRPSTWRVCQFRHSGAGGSPYLRGSPPRKSSPQPSTGPRFHGPQPAPSRH